jgi:hypothetical protein
MGKHNKGLKPASLLSSDLLKKPLEAPNSDSQTPIFSFRYVHKAYCGCQANGANHAKVWDRIERNSELTWEEIKKLPRFNGGAEPIKKVKKPLPEGVTPEVKLLSFHTNANFARIIGYRAERTFYVLWVDCDGDVYDH